MDNANKKESKLQAFFKKDNPKILMILNGLTAAIWMLITAMNIRSLIVYDQINRFNLYLDGGLALFYIGMTLAYVCKYVKAKKHEKGETL